VRGGRKKNVGPVQKRTTSKERGKGRFVAFIEGKKNITFLRKVAVARKKRDFLRKKQGEGKREQRKGQDQKRKKGKGKRELGAPVTTSF